MLYDCLPKKMIEDPNAMRELNAGNIGDMKSQNLPRDTIIIKYFEIRKKFKVKERSY